MSNQKSFTTTHGKNPKQIHIAHRRSPSELTNLMIEQIHLQRQLELVQQQQQQILQQESNNNNNSSYRGHAHRRSNSGSNFNNNNHRRAQSSITGAMGSFAMPQASLAPPPKISNPQQGHNRRHSLGLNEAKKAAAQVQAQRAGKDVDHEEVPQNNFKFPSTSIEPPSRGHNRSRSINNNNNNNNNSTSPSRSFQFPPPAPQNNFLNPNDLLLPPPQPNYHERRQSNHYRSNSRNSGDMNSNWRRQQSPSKSSSSSFDDNNNNNYFTPGHRSRGSFGNSISSIANFQVSGVNQQNGRKSLFAPYLPQSSISDLVAEGRLVVGTLRVNKKNRSDAYVSTDGLLDADIFICGSKDRNRALEGDLVAVELLSVDEVWNSKREKEEKKRRKDHNSTNSISLKDNDDVHNDASTHSTSNKDDDESNQHPGLKRKGSLKQRPTLKKNDDVEVEGQSLLLVEEEEINDEYKPLYAGHVVAVIDRIPGQLFSGTLGLLRPSQQQQQQQSNNNNNSNHHHNNNRPKIVWFKPTDKKVPLIAIPTEQAPKDFVENVDVYSNKLFVASIKRWPITSLHPFGTLIGELGDLNDPDIEVEAILRDNNFICDEYLLNPNDLTKEREDFEIEDIDYEEEFKIRKDFTQEYVLAISENGEFSDNAIHVKRLSSEKIELGIHVSDVSSFIKEGSNLDKNSRKRSTTVTLAQKIVNLYPKKINELLSFEKNLKSLAISVCFEIDTKNFEIDNVLINESFIQPKIKLTYDEIDSILNDEDSSSSSAAKDYIKTISLISKEFKRQRLENSKLTNEINLTLLDQIDDEKLRLHLNIFETNLSFNILNEIFLKVNCTVAQRNYAILGDEAFLRRQSLPTLTKLETFKKKISNFGIELDTSSSSKLINSILNIENETTRQIVEILFYKTLSRSKYFIAGKVEPENFGAFYFNLPLYTHFTSPLKRYSDLIVHRQLKSILKDTYSKSNEDETSKEDVIESLKMTSEYCNFKKDCAKNAQDQSIHLILCKTINDMSKNIGQLIVLAKISQVYESSFDVFIPEFGIEKRVHGDQLPLKKCEFDKKEGLLELYWEKGVDSATFIPEDERNKLSYRNSIKNKFKVGANEIARVLSERTKKEKSASLSDTFSEELSNLKLSPPTISNDKKDLNEFFKDLKLRKENDDDFIQEIRELQTIPILLRAEIGMALPCLTVHALNPFINE